MGHRIIIGIFLIFVVLGVSCSKKGVVPENPLDRFISGVSFGSDTLITDMTRPLIVSFITLMDQQSVENAFSCEPQFPSTPHWTLETHFNPVDPDVGTDHLQFYLFPETPFIPNTTYRCVIDTTAKDVNDVNLPVPFEFEFTTAPSMLRSIKIIYDQVDSHDCFPIAIRLSFNTSIDLSNAGQPFTVDPPFEYKLNGISREKHLLEYKIMTPLKARTHYQVQFSGEISDAWGNRIDTDTSLAFDTGPVELIYYYPHPGLKLKSTSPIIQVRFNTVMDRPSTEAAFRFGAGMGKISGTFYWMTDKAVQFFYNLPLIRGETYTINVDSTASDIYGTPLQEPFSYNFVY